MTENEYNQEDIMENNLQKIQNNLYHVKCKNQLSDSIINFFTMAIGFFMFGCMNAEILYSNETKYLFFGNLIIAGIAQTILGIYEWYKGKSISILINFSFGLLFISWFFKYNLIDQGEIVKDKSYEGTVYTIWFLLSLIIIVAVKNKGIIYSLNYIAVTAGFAFLFIDKFADQNLLKKIYGYIFIVAGGLFWITGLLRLVSSSFLNDYLGIIKE